MKTVVYVEEMSALHLPNLKVAEIQEITFMK